MPEQRRPAADWDRRLPADAVAALARLPGPTHFGPVGLQGLVEDGTAEACLTRPAVGGFQPGYGVGLLSRLVVHNRSHRFRRAVGRRHKPCALCVPAARTVAASIDHHFEAMARRLVPAGHVAYQVDADFVVTARRQGALELLAGDGAGEDGLVRLSGRDAVESERVKPALSGIVGVPSAPRLPAPAHIGLGAGRRRQGAAAPGRGRDAPAPSRGRDVSPEVMVSPPGEAARGHHVEGLDRVHTLQVSVF